MSRIRVLVAKPGLDGHDRGAKVVARGLRDAGMEVVYSHRTPSQIVQTALEEDVQVVGLSTLSGAHNRLVTAVAKGLAAEGMSDVLVLAGGSIIPEADIQNLKDRRARCISARDSDRDHRVIHRGQCF